MRRNGAVEQYHAALGQAQVYGHRPHLQRRRGKPKLRYVYDIADTPARPVARRCPTCGKLPQAKHDAIREALERQYGPSGEMDFGNQLMEQARRAVNAVYRDDLTDLAYDTKDSLLRSWMISI